MSSVTPADNVEKVPTDAPSSLTSFTGWDVRGGAAAGLGSHEALALSQSKADGKVEIYELLAVAARGFRPPAFLTITDLSVADLQANQEGEQQDEQFGDFAGFRQTWSLDYRLIAEPNPRTTAPHAIYLLGVNPPVGATEQDLQVFNDFYTNVHLPEVAERRNALRSVRYELVREAKPPFKGAPRFLAIYEVDEASASNRRHVGPAYSSGPEVWQGHKTPWRLWYRLLGPR